MSSNKIIPSIHYPYLLSIHIEMNEMGNKLSERIMKYTLNTPTSRLYMNDGIPKLMKSHHMRYSMNKEKPFLNRDRLEDIELIKPLDVIAFSVSTKITSHGDLLVEKIIFEILQKKTKNRKNMYEFLEVEDRVKHLINFIHDNKKLNESNASEWWIVSSNITEELVTQSIVISF